MAFRRNKSREVKELVQALLKDEEVQELGERLWKRLEPMVVSAMKKRRESQERPN